MRRYTEGGERAVANFEAGYQGYESRAYRGLGVFVSMPVRCCALSPARVAAHSVGGSPVVG